MAFEKKPVGLLRMAARLPVHLYRARLGWLLGSRFLMLTHTGRVSGRERYTVLEVVDHDMEAAIYFVAASWGERSQWLQNLAAQPSARITVGRHDLAVRAVRLDRTGTEQVFRRCADRHPQAFRKLAKFMTGAEVKADAQGAVLVAESVPVVALKEA